MATYKVLQDIEAEDKLIGPLTLRQFIYGLAAALFGYLTFLVISKGAPFMAIIFLPLALIPAFLPGHGVGINPQKCGRLRKIRFALKPRKRIWNQSGIKELVTITVPKRVEQVFTNGLTQTEVRDRLHALADTIDSRGWAIKNVNVNMSAQPSAMGGGVVSDRLVNLSSLPQPVSNVDVKASDDILDVQNNRVAQQFNNMINASTKAHRQQVIDKLQSPEESQAQAPRASSQAGNQSQPNNYWFLNEPSQAAAYMPQNAVTFNTQVVAPGEARSDLPVAAANPTPDEESFIKQLKAEPLFSPNIHGHLHVIQPLSEQNSGQKAAVATQAQQISNNPQPHALQQPLAPVTQATDAAILDLVRNNDLNVATIAREAQKRKDSPQDEVVISLH